MPPQKNTARVKLHVVENQPPRKRNFDGSRNVYADTNGRCMESAKPCYETGCRYHLGPHALGLADRDGESPTCALDVANHGPATLSDIGDLLGFTREAIRQVEAKALKKLIANGFIKTHGKDHLSTRDVYPREDILDLLK
jgi:hypothetical protein